MLFKSSPYETCLYMNIDNQLFKKLESLYNIYSMGNLLGSAQPEPPKPKQPQQQTSYLSRPNYPSYESYRPSYTQQNKQVSKPSTNVEKKHCESTQIFCTPYTQTCSFFFQHQEDNRDKIITKVETQKPITQYSSLPQHQISTTQKYPSYSSYIDSQTRSKNQERKEVEQKSIKVNTQQFPTLLSSAYQAPSNYQTQSRANITVRPSVKKPVTLPSEQTKPVKEKAIVNKTKQSKNDEVKLYMRKDFDQDEQSPVETKKKIQYKQKQENQQPQNKPSLKVSQPQFNQEEQYYQDDEDSHQGRRYQRDYNDYSYYQNQFHQYEPRQYNSQEESEQSDRSDRSDRYESGSDYDEEERKERAYKYTSQDAKRLSKLGQRRGDKKLSLEECRDQIEDQLIRLNKYYKYKFEFEEEPEMIEDGKKMTRTIYLFFDCSHCPQKNKWTSISGTFEITFRFYRKQNLLCYHVEVFRTKCRFCKKYMNPYIYQTQMDAMKIFFSVIVTSIIDRIPPPERPPKYYIRQVHHHKSEWCEACQLGRCSTQNRN